MKNRFYLNKATLPLLIASLLIAGKFSAQWGTGNIVAYRVGDGAGALTSAAAPVFIDQYTNTGTFVNSFAVPTTGADRLVASGSATADGKLSLSTNGSSIVFTGYDAAVGTPSVATSSGATVNRIVGKMDLAYVYSQPFSSATLHGSNNIRSACSDGTNVWCAGNGAAATGGTTYFGPGAAVQVSATTLNQRAVKIFNGQLYYVTASGTNRGVYAVGSGTPTTTGQVAVNVINTGGSSNSTDLAFNPCSTICYIADDRSLLSGGGVQRWELIAGVWTLQYTLAVSTSSGSTSICVDWSGANPIVYSTGLNATTMDIVKIIDTGPGSAFSVLASSPANTFWRGITFAPSTCTPVAWYQDSDGDGFGNNGVSQMACTAPCGYVANNTDCNDASNTIYPGAPEIIDNGTDENCNGGETCYCDADNDGYLPDLLCTTNSTDFDCTDAFEGQSGDPTGDCDDNTLGVNPGVTEICANGVDDDCDLSIDEDDPACQNGATVNMFCGCDCPPGYSGFFCEIAADSDFDGVPDLTDCEPYNPAVYPGAAELCNGADDNCNGNIDEGYDTDMDGYTSCGGDCDDSDPNKNPGEVEQCNGYDDDCNGSTDEGFDLDFDGYTSCGGDCDDGDGTVNPGMAEVCGNGIDDDCDALTDEGCVIVPGEDPSNAIPIAVTNLGTCTATNGDLTGHTASVGALTIATTGEDFWYSFVATKPGVRIEVGNTPMNDIIIELQDNMGTLIDSEDAQATQGFENLNYGGLIVGNTYIVGVRNSNSAGGIGAYTICVQAIGDSQCNYGPGPYSLCSTFKAVWIGGGVNYIFHFESQTDNDTFVKNNGASTFCVLSTVPNLEWNDTYDVVIGAEYTLSYAGGNEQVEVLSDNPCFIVVNPQPNAFMRPQDNCVNFGPHLLGHSVAANAFVCPAIDWKWEFTRTDIPELPITHYKGNSNRYLTLSTVAGLTPGGVYDVRVAPVFSYGDGDYGTVDCLSLAGPVLINTETETENQSPVKSETDELQLALYPNPNNGAMVNLNLTDVESETALVTVADALGNLVYKYTLVANNGSVNTIITFDRELASGVYVVSILEGEELFNMKLVVEN